MRLSAMLIRKLNGLLWLTLILPDPKEVKQIEEGLSDP
jgi:hypothetical protein